MFHEKTSDTKILNILIKVRDMKERKAKWLIDLRTRFLLHRVSCEMFFIYELEKEFFILIWMFKYNLWVTDRISFALIKSASSWDEATQPAGCCALLSKHRRGHNFQVSSQRSQKKLHDTVKDFDNDIENRKLWNAKNISLMAK